jgi:hypothetical protein
MGSLTMRGCEDGRIECGVPDRYCVQLRPTCPDFVVLCAVDAPLT